MNNKIYTVKRLRLLTFLVNKGFTEYTVIPDPTSLKGDFRWFVFERTPELDEALTEYFSQFNNGS